jgi:antitoxin ParD1/3/4
MNVSLTPELEEMISRKVKSGMYNSASEVIREGLRRMFKEDSIKPQITETQRLQPNELQREVMKGVEQIRNGEGTVVEPEKLDEFFDDIINRGKKRFEESRRNMNGKY